MSTTTRPWIAGRREGSAETFDVRSPYDGELIGRVNVTTPEQVERAVTGAVAVEPTLLAMTAQERAAALMHVSARIAERHSEIADLICAESGKPVRWAAAEAARASSTFRWAAEEARRWSGAVQRLDTDPGGEGRLAIVRRFPRGPVLGISPFNFPLNLAAHKVAPALAVGAPIVLKPAPKTPLSALLLGEWLAETDLPTGSWSVLTVPDQRMEALVADPRLPVISFTGSGPVGWQIRAAVPAKHVTLELGGNGAVLVADDWSSDADLRWAAERIATFSNYQAGQSCVAVQRVYADERVHDRLLERLVAAVERLRTGDPREAVTDVGPCINLESAERIAAWVDEAVRLGAKVHTGGHRVGTTYAPTVLTGVAPQTLLARQEVFGPVLFVEAVTGLADGLGRIDDSEFGLQAGIFTHDTATAFLAHRSLRVGGVVVGDVPTYRADQMPYGGTKASGTGREGPRAAMEDFTEERVLVLTGVPL